MFENIKACLFDLDGTLIDSMGLWKEIDRSYFEKYGKELPDDYQQQIEGLNMVETAIYTREHFGFDVTVEEMMNEWNEMARVTYHETIQFKPHAKEALLMLKDRGIKLGVVTSNSKYLFEGFTTSSGLLDIIDTAVDGDDVAKGKPDPECYLTAAGRLQVKPEECLAFEDIIVGLTAGKNAGMKTVAVEDSYSTNKWQEKVDYADYAIVSYAELIEIIAEEL